MSHHQLFAILGQTTVQEMMREREREEWGARKPCSLGVGCDEYGVCYANANGQPDRCEAEREAVEGVCVEDSFYDNVAVEDREPSPVVSLADDIPDYFAGIKQPNPINQEDSE